MTEIILARHGETEWNIKEMFRGRTDVKLDEAGIKQAESLSQYLRDSPIEAIYSSPLWRALKTAEIIASNQRLEVTIAPGLIDFDYGDWQGLSRYEVKDKYKGLYTEWLKNPHRVRMPGGENLNEVRKRAMRVVREVIAGYSGTVVLVSHRVVNKVLICALLGLDNSHFWNIRQDIGAITIFNYENQQFVLVEHNNTSYLPSLQQKKLSDF
jgi:broad specificity phosphatase PhoE